MEKTEILRGLWRFPMGGVILPRQEGSEAMKDFITGSEEAKLERYERLNTPKWEAELKSLEARVSTAIGDQKKAIEDRIAELKTFLKR